MPSHLISSTFLVFATASVTSRLSCGDLSISDIISSRPRVPNWPSFVVSNAIAEDETSNNTNGTRRANILRSSSRFSTPAGFDGFERFWEAGGNVVDGVGQD